jgi:hypothetical protein
MSRAGFERAIPIFERPKTVHALDHVTIGAGMSSYQTDKL